MNNITLGQLKKLETLSEVARPLDDADWGSDRQQDAENHFWNELARALGAPCDDQYDGAGFGKDFDNWCLHATTDEMLDEALKLLREYFERGFHRRVTLNEIEAHVDWLVRIGEQSMGNFTVAEAKLYHDAVDQFRTFCELAEEEEK